MVALAAVRCRQGEETTAPRKESYATKWIGRNAPPVLGYFEESFHLRDLTRRTTLIRNYESHVLSGDILELSLPQTSDSLILAKSKVLSFLKKRKVRLEVDIKKNLLISLIYHHLRPIDVKKENLGLLDGLVFKNYNLFEHLVSFSRAICISVQIQKLPLTLSYHHFIGYRVIKDWKTDDIFYLRSVLLQYYYRQLRQNTPGDSLDELDEKSIVSIIKFSLAREFSFRTQQTLPVGGFYLKILPKSCDISKSSDEQTRLFFTLLRSSKLCKDVSDDFVCQALEKHAKTLSEPRPAIPARFKQFCYEKAQEFGILVESIYNPHQTSIPPCTASFERSRANGGVLKELIEQKILTRTRGEGNLPRVEPLTIGLFGPPGSGKTITLEKIKSDLRIFLGIPSHMKDSDFCYSRSSFSEHWDGYHQQPVVLMDDFGQDAINGLDLAQFDSSVSSACWFLPMAKLEEKGIQFNSKIVILTSNLKFGQAIYLGPSGPPMIQIASLWRRIHLPYNIVSNTGLTQSLEQGTETRSIRKFFRINPDYKQHERAWSEHYAHRSALSNVEYDAARMPVTYSTTPSSFGELMQEFRLEYVRRYELYFENLGIWKQNIMSGDFIVTPSKREEVTDEACPSVPKTSYTEAVLEYRDGYNQSIDLLFPLHPPPVKKCKVVGLKEPLKVRVITAGQAVTRVLKPLQEAMWKTLASYPALRLAHGVDEDINLKKVKNLKALDNALGGMHLREGERYLSGDYSSATDNFPMELTSTLLEGILSKITHGPTKEWARWEISSAELYYPGKSAPILQRSGQLMGSLLSFPLLCLANYCLCIYSGMDPDRFLINGDDLAAPVTKSVYRSWKKNATSISLVPSIGKNHLSNRMATFNSQLFLFNQRQNRLVLVNTGKMSLAYRGKTDPIGSTFSDLQVLYGDSDMLRETFLYLNVTQLSRSPRSLCIPETHGGFGNCFRGKFDPYLGKKVYFASLFSRVYSPPVQIPGTNHFLVPDVYFLPSDVSEEAIQSLERCFINKNLISKVLASAYREETINDDIPLSDMTKGELGEIWKKLNQLYPMAEEICRSAEYRLSTFPSLKRLRFGYAAVHRYSVDSFRARQVEGTFEQFLTDGFSYGTDYVPCPFIEDTDTVDLPTTKMCNAPHPPIHYSASVSNILRRSEKHPFRWCGIYAHDQEFPTWGYTSLGVSPKLKTLVEEEFRLTSIW